MSIPDFNLRGKVVVVSGGARGLGLAQAEALLQAGAQVYVLDRLRDPPPEFLAVQARAKQNSGASLEYRELDVREVDHLNKTLEDIANTRGRMDGLIAAAGIQQEIPALNYAASDVNRMQEINVTGVLMTAQAVAKQMIRHGTPGSLVLIATAYNASKAGVVQLGRSLAAELGPYGIRVNTLSPGYILTALVQDLFREHPEREIDWSKQNMLGRLSKPEEYQGAAIFLLSDASSFMTGADLRMDGGHCAW